MLAFEEATGGYEARLWWDCKQLRRRGVPEVHLERV